MTGNYIYGGDRNSDHYHAGPLAGVGPGDRTVIGTGPHRRERLLEHRSAKAKDKKVRGAYCVTVNKL